MHSFTLSNRIQRGIRLSPPESGNAWFLRLGQGDRAVQVPALEPLSSYLTKVDKELRAASRGAASMFGDVDQQLAERAMAEVYEGWLVDQLAYDAETGSLAYVGDHHPRGGPCLLHLNVPNDGKAPELEAGSYREVLEGGRVRRVYDDIADAAGVMPLQCGYGPKEHVEHLFRMERGASFRIKSSGPWGEALVLWTGQELKLLPSRKQRREEGDRRQAQPARA